MKKLRQLLFASAILCCTCFWAAAQNSTNDLIKQGVDLHNEGKYADAISKFEEVLKTEPDNGYANYEIAFSLYKSKKPLDAIPHLEKALKSSNTSLSVAAHALLASIYDEDNQPKKAIDIYKEAIKLNADYPQIYYNLGIAYSRDQQYAEAENAAIEAIKHSPKNISSLRLYALATFHQNKRMNALLGLCSVILLDPQGPRAAEAYGNIQHIMQGGVLKDSKGNTAISVSPTDDKDAGAMNLGITLAATAGQAKKLAGAELLQYELTTDFALAGQLAEKKNDKNFFDKFFAAYFYKLSQTNNMAAVAHTIAFTDKTIDSTEWLKENMTQLTALTDWIKTTERGF